MIPLIVYKLFIYILINPSLKKLNCIKNKFKKINFFNFFNDESNVNEEIIINLNLFHIV